MGLGDIVSNTLIRVKADTSDAKAQIRSLRGVEKQAAQERLAEIESTNKAIDGQIAMVGQIGLAVGASVAAFKLAKDAADSYLEDMRLEAAAAGSDLGKLQEATSGLVEADNLLAFAGKAMHGVWKLNQKEMETVLHGAMALRKTMGVELQPTIDALTEALAKGSTRALKEFGIEAKDKEEALRKLDGLFRGLGGHVALAGDEMSEAGVTFKNAMDDIKGGLGEIVVELAPLVRLVADLVGWLAKVKDLLPEGVKDGLLSQLPGGVGSYFGNKRAAADAFNALPTLFDNPVVQGLQNVERAKLAAAGAKEFGVALGTAILDGLKTASGLARPHNSSSKRLKGEGGFELNFTEASGFSGYDTLSQKFEADAAHADLLSQVGRMGSLPAMNENVPAWQRLGTDKVSGVFDEFNKLQDQKELEGKQKILEQIFGTPTEIDALTVSLSAAASMFGTITEAAGAAFDAWITGSKSLGQAFKEAVAEGLRATAVQMAMEAIKHTAFGFGALAFGPIMGATAAEHFKAAALFAAGAVVVGAAAKGLGSATGQWAHGGGAGAGGGGASRTIGNGSAQQDNRPIHVYVGAEWAAMSKIEQADAIVRAVDLGRRSSPHIRRA